MWYYVQHGLLSYYRIRTSNRTSNRTSFIGGGDINTVAKMIKRLTDLKVKRLTKFGSYPDGGGLYLQVSKTGAKSWFFRYQVSGKGRKKGLGPYPTTTLVMARGAAHDCQVLRDQGIDPIQYEQQKKIEEELKAGRAKTFRYCAEKYIESHKAEWSNAKHEYQWTQSLSAYAYPFIGQIPVQDVDVGLVLEVLEPIWHTKTETATRVRQRMETILDWATARNYRSGVNSALWKGHLDKILPKPTKIRKVKHHPALPYIDTPEYFRGLRETETLAAKTLAFIILTATRGGEARCARWEEIGGDIWIIPAERMKSRRPFRVPLSNEALNILEEVKPMERGGMVFPGSRIPISDTSVRKLLKQTYPDLTTHGFRSSFRDWCAERSNYSREVAEAALSHILRDKTEAAYQRGDLIEKRARLMNAWEQYLLTFEKNADVVPINKKA